MVKFVKKFCFKGLKRGKVQFPHKTIIMWSFNSQSLEKIQLDFKWILSFAPRVSFNF